MLKSLAMDDFPTNDFLDIFEANLQYAEHFQSTDLTGVAARGLAIITCMDSRIDPLAVTGMQAGDVKILRNAGARVTEDVLRTLVLATTLLGVDRILVMPHTHCKMASGTEPQIHELIDATWGIDTRSLEFRTTENQLAALKLDLERIRAFPYFHPNITVAGAIYDVHTGALRPVDY